MKPTSKTPLRVSASFRDAQGHEWHPRVTCGTLTRFETAANVSVFEEFRKMATDGSALPQMKLTHLMILAYQACLDEANLRKTSFEEFCESFDSDVQLKGLIDTTTEALVKFFQSQTKSGEQS